MFFLSLWLCVSKVCAEPVIAVLEPSSGAWTDQKLRVAAQMRRTIEYILRPKNYYVLNQSEQLILLEAAAFPSDTTERGKATYADWYFVFRLSKKDAYNVEISLFERKDIQLHTAKIQNASWDELEKKIAGVLQEQLAVLLMRPKPSVQDPPLAVQKILLLRIEEGLRREWYWMFEDPESFGKVAQVHDWFNKGMREQRNLNSEGIKADSKVLHKAHKWLEARKKRLPRTPQPCTSIENYASSWKSKSSGSWDGTVLSFPHGSVEMLWEVALQCIPDWRCAQSSLCETEQYEARFFYEDGPRLNIKFKETDAE